MVIKHAGQWYEGTSAERIGIGLPTRNGVWFYDTEENTLYYLYNGTWTIPGIAGDGYNPLVYSATPGAAVATDDVETDIFTYTIPADTLLAGYVLKFKIVVYVDNDVNLDSGLFRFRWESSYGNELLFTSPTITCDGTSPFYFIVEGSMVVDAAADNAFGSCTLDSGDQSVLANALNNLATATNPFDVDIDLRFTGVMGGTGTGLIGTSAEIYIYHGG